MTKTEFVEKYAEKTGMSKKDATGSKRILRSNS
jgi:nucleoid DNA-binding protein